MSSIVSGLLWYIKVRCNGGAFGDDKLQMKQYLLLAVELYNRKVEVERHPWV